MEFGIWQHRDKFNFDDAYTRVRVLDGRRRVQVLREGSRCGPCGRHIGALFSLSQKSKEPLLLVAQIKYQVAVGSSIENACKAWDIWTLYYDWNDRQDLEKVIALGSSDDGRIEWTKVLAIPLYSIKRVEDAEQLMAQVRGVPEVCA